MLDNTATRACEISVSELNDAAAVLRLAADAKAYTPVLGSVLFEGSTITSTDIDKRAVWKLDAPVAAPFCIPLAALQKVLKGADKGKLVSFSLQDDRAVIDCDGLVSRIATFPVADFPRDVAGSATDRLGSAEMPETEMHAWLSFVSPAMSDEETRYYLKGIYMHGFRGRLSAVATDGHRLAFSPRSDAWEDGAGGIVPRDTVKALLSMLDKKSKGAVTIDIFRNASRVTSQKWELQSRHVDGSFPDYTRVIPKASDTWAQLDVKKTVASLKRLHGLQDTRARRVELDTAAGEMRAHTDDGSHAMPLPSIETAGEVEAGFNSGYLIDALSAFPDAKSLRMELDATNPALIGDRDADFYVVMPMRRV